MIEPVKERVTESHARSIIHLLLPAAWMSILLGIAVECAILVTRLAAGASPYRDQSLVEFAASVSWSTIVCSGIALGTAVVRQRDRIMGLLGLICAPLGWAIAKGIQRSAQWMLGTSLDTIGALIVEVGALKTIEYSLLGYFVGKLVRSPRSTLARHGLLGLATGILFGSPIVALNIWHAPAHHLALAKVLGLATNELLFPIGCSIVLHFIGQLADRHVSAD